MSEISERAWRCARIAGGRMHQRLGWRGMAGAVLVFLAIDVGGQAGWAQRQMPRDIAAAQVEITHRQAATAKAAQAVAALARVLPTREDVPSVLGQIARGAALSGLGWPAANYQLVSASDTAPASLEVRCNFKGAYPKLRSFLDDYLMTIPGATVRELSMTRPNSEVADVDAKFVLAVLLQDDASAPLPPKQEAAK